MKLCTPALIYFVLAIVSILIMVVKHTPTMFLMGNLVFVVLWTWFLNLICTNGFTNISWALVVSPYIILFIMHLMQPKVTEEYGEDVDEEDVEEDVEEEEEKNETMVVM